MKQRYSSAKRVALHCISQLYYTHAVNKYQLLMISSLIFHYTLQYVFIDFFLCYFNHNKATFFNIYCLHAHLSDNLIPLKVLHLLWGMFFSPSYFVSMPTIRIWVPIIGSSQLCIYKVAV